ncbi:toxic anion resistance protein [Lachnoclostridium sp. Marseille-P6806]|uniref:toxic anion resistance protein n=1 Tax=Lachnoclostridium sp. Marseille-P6806 TaxID=2364793 RepID=UPI0010304DE9|nr:toxic anion resistance protein [Lachnoclostridium sp. Marseille-P6806]
MTEEFKEFEEQAPTLEFGTAPQEEQKPAAQEIVRATPETMLKDAESVLSKTELAQVDAFVKQIDIANSAAIMNYGAGTQKKLADFSERALDNVRTKDMGETGEMLTQLITQLKDFNVDGEQKGFMGLFRKAGNRAEELRARYSKVETNVTTISTELEKHQVTLLKDVEVLDRMYEMNLNYFKEMTMYVLAGKKKLAEVRTGKLVELQNKAAQTGLAEDAQAAKDLAAQCDRFEKKIYDLELTRTIAMQTAPQIRMVQNSDTMMAEKIQSTIVNTIPLWKNQMVIAMGVEHATQAARAERQVNDMTNELLKKNAAALKVATVESAKEAERGIVDIETLRQTNETLISAMDEVITIQKEGKQKRHDAELELADIENQLKAKLLEAARG